MDASCFIQAAQYFTNMYVMHIKDFARILSCPTYFLYLQNSVWTGKFDAGTLRSALFGLSSIPFCTSATRVSK